MIDLKKVVDRMIEKKRENIPFRIIRIINLIKGRSHGRKV